MNKLAVIVVMLVGLAACSNKKTEEGKEPPATTAIGAPSGGAPAGASAGSTGAANPGASAANPVPASGSAADAGSAAGAGSAGAGSAVAEKPEAPASGTVGCATAVTLTCGADQQDGCAAGLTTVHVCVAKDAKAGVPCAQEVALKCPAGQLDGCLHNPPQAASHVCVIAGKPTP